MTTFIWNRILALRELPSKYYLSHFNEFMAYLKQHCGNLLLEEHSGFIQTVDALEHDALCLLVRIINRRGQMLEKCKLDYLEIPNCQQQIDSLVAHRLLSPLTYNDLPVWLNSLTKAQLLKLSQELGIDNVTGSMKKASLLYVILASRDIQQAMNTSLAKDFVNKHFINIWQYLLFLFFGNVKSGLDQFSLRDLGLLKTRNKDSKHAARFETLKQAQSAFYFCTRDFTLKYSHISDEKLIFMATSQMPTIVGETAQRYADEFYYQLGKRLLKVDSHLALNTLSQSALAKSQEKVLREKFKLGNKSEVKAKLEAILLTSQDAALCAFAEDFYQRKYKQVKLSKQTHMLRYHSQTIWIDELYRDSPEKGVKAYYQQRGAVVIRTENRLFPTLFLLLFWTELYHEDKQAIACEFDRRPSSVRENRVYKTLGPLLENKLEMLLEPEKAIAYLAKIAAKYYGQPNGIFRWNSKILLILNQFLLAAPPHAVIAQLRAIAQDYHGLQDGYPDLMIIEKNKLRFEEVKAEGDAIRPNQMVTIERLQNSGFDVSICRVNWAINPLQTYVVVDVETTGGKSAGHRITEIGAVKVVNGKVIDTWTSLINPQRHIPKFITQLTGISDALVSDAPLFCDVIDDLELFLRDSIFVAHNVNFDYGFFRLEYERLGRTFSMPKLCTVREMRKCFSGLNSYSLSNLCREFGIQLTSHHRALCDAQAAAELLIMVNSVKQQRLINSN